MFLGLLFLNGIIVNGPYSLMTTAISADLVWAVCVSMDGICLIAINQGHHKSLRGNSRALATVSAIIDGTGSIGLLSYCSCASTFNLMRCL